MANGILQALVRAREMIEFDVHMAANLRRIGHKRDIERVFMGAEVVVGRAIKQRLRVFLSGMREIDEV